MQGEEVLKTALRVWGEEIQQAIAIEEMSELTKAIVKTWRGGDTNPVVEEIADVQIMLWQLSIIYGIDNVEEIVIEKLERLERRLGNQNQISRKEEEDE